MTMIQNFIQKYQRTVRVKQLAISYYINFDCFHEGNCIDYIFLQMNFVGALSTYDTQM